METTFSEYKEDFQNIANHLLETPESAVYINGAYPPQIGFRTAMEPLSEDGFKKK